MSLWAVCEATLRVFCERRTQESENVSRSVDVDGRLGVARCV